jgi:putative SOS response-associated peptidase YedK
LGCELQCCAANFSTGGTPESRQRDARASPHALGLDSLLVKGCEGRLLHRQCQGRDGGPTAPAFREPFKRRRCLVPADAFYEWQKLDAKHKQPFAIALSSGEPYGFAGVWDRWKDPASREWLETFSIITTDPNQVVAALHNRMPVIIERKNYARWLGGSNAAQPPLDLLRPFPAEQMIAWKVGKVVGNVRNDAAQLLEPPTPEDCA